MIKLTREKARRLRELIEKVVVFLDDEEALDGVLLFQNWEPDKEYIVNDRFRYEGKLYKVLQNHTSQSDWLPDITPSLYVEVAEPGPCMKTT